MDRLTQKHRSWNMSRVHSEDTKPEIVVRLFLHRHGFRYVLHDKRLPGKPDIVLPKYKTVIEVRGCFWHRHKDCKIATMPSTHVEFWQEKFKRNVERDNVNESELRKLGWNIIVVWECEIKSRLNDLPAIIRRNVEK
jgi:DNA mismatch endonuclease (patch repair protein)